MDYFVPTLVQRQTASTTTSAAPSASTSASSGGGGGTTPSLFFIALGVGVVFTNLWLIIGIKYCCRHRRMRHDRELNDYDETNEELRAFPFYNGRAGAGVTRFRPAPRRKREKKLLTLEQLDEKAPLVKYKDWCDNRKENGLSTEGGISSAAVQAMAASTNTSGVRVLDSKTREDGPAEQSKQATTSDVNPLQSSQSLELEHNSQKDNSMVKVEEMPEAIEEREPAVTFDSGDLCAICIDNLESDDDVRMLPCHHVFHSDCVTPWLTTRRALCPLCKTDFYVSPLESQQVGIESEISTPQAAFAVSASENPQLMYPWEVFVRPPRQHRVDSPGRREQWIWSFRRTTTQDSVPSHRNWFWRRRRSETTDASPV